MSRSMQKNEEKKPEKEAVVEMPSSSSTIALLEKIHGKSIYEDPKREDSYRPEVPSASKLESEI